MLNYLVPVFVSSFKLISLLLIFPILAGYPMHFLSLKLNSISMKSFNRSFIFSVLKWPGTIVHELSHAFAGLLSLRQIKEVVLCDHDPPLEDGGYKLGYVRFKFNPVNTFQEVGCLLICASPILAGAFLFKLLFEKYFNTSIAPDLSLFTCTFEFSIQFFQQSMGALGQACMNGMLLLINPRNFTNPYFYIFIVCTFLLSISVDLSKADINILKIGIKPTIFIIVATNLFIHWFYPLGEVLVHKTWFFFFTFYFQLIFAAIVMAIIGGTMIMFLQILPFGK